MTHLLLADFFFQNYFFKKFLSGILKECQTNSLDPDQGFIRVQIACKGYQRMTQDLLARKESSIRSILEPNIGH